MRRRFLNWLGEICLRVIVWIERDSNSVNYTRRETTKSGFDAPDSFYGGMVATACIELAAVFTVQGHSGMSASIVRGLMNKLLAFEPLMPLTGEDDEWHDPDRSLSGLYQNRRYGSVFKDGKDGRPYQGDYYVFREPNGVTFGASESRKYITFPYTPGHETIDVPGDTSSEVLAAAVRRHENLKIIRGDGPDGQFSW